MSGQTLVQFHFFSVTSGCIDLFSLKATTSLFPGSIIRTHVKLGIPSDTHYVNSFILLLFAYVLFICGCFAHICNICLLRSYSDSLCTVLPHATKVPVC